VPVDFQSPCRRQPYLKNFPSIQTNLRVLLKVLALSCSIEKFSFLSREKASEIAAKYLDKMSKKQENR
jgi:hypothetical protein